MKLCNIQRHLDTHHATLAAKHSAGDIRHKACQELLKNIPVGQQQLHAWATQGDWTSASFEGALSIVKNEKPFTVGEFDKNLMLDLANELFDDFPNKDKVIKTIKDMPLSARTVHDRPILMANQVEETQIKDINTSYERRIWQFCQ